MYIIISSHCHVFTCSIEIRQKLACTFKPALPMESHGNAQRVFVFMLRKAFAEMREMGCGVRNIFVLVLSYDQTERNVPLWQLEVPKIDLRFLRLNQIILSEIWLMDSSVIK